MIRKIALLGLIALVLVMPVSAAYNCSYPHVAGYFSGNAPWIFPTGIVTSTAEAKLLCSAAGYPNNSVQIRFNAYDSDTNLLGYGNSANYLNYTVTYNLTRFVSRACYCDGNSAYVIRMSDGAAAGGTGSDKVDVFYRTDTSESECLAGTIPYKEVNFTATPTTGSAPLSVAFTAYNVTNTTGASWSFGDGNVSSFLATTSHLYPNQGTYTVRLDYFNLTGYSGYVQKNNYITVGAPNATATTYAVARDLYTGFAINGAQVNMYDVENTSWTNTTTTNGIGSITTLLGHKINIWGSAVGYQDDNLQNMPAVDGGYYSLLLKPSNLTTYNTTAGNLTLIVTVQDLQLPHPTIQGAEVTAAWGSQYASGTTNAAGNTFFTVPNNTAIHLSAFKSGYASGSSTHITGSANGGPTTETAIMYIGTDYVTPVPTVTLTTGPGGTIPQTVDPYPCVGDGSPEDTANCQRKQSSMAADLISYGPDLVQFFIMLTFIGGLLLITKR